MEKFCNCETQRSNASHASPTSTLLASTALSPPKQRIQPISSPKPLHSHPDCPLTLPEKEGHSSDLAVID
uniref:Uncharacterized protein n=1 Tax=Solanum lycopersicum TaxID=4081 RepID=A0A3Q7JD27_SOLLC